MVFCSVCNCGNSSKLCNYTNKGITFHRKSGTRADSPKKLKEDIAVSTSVSNVIADLVGLEDTKFTDGIVTRHKRHDVITKKDKYDKHDIKNDQQKKKEAIITVLKKKKAAIKEIIHKKKHAILEKKKKFEKHLAASWFKIRAASKAKHEKVAVYLNNPDLIYEHILKIVRDALRKHMESSCTRLSITTKHRRKRQTPTLHKPPARNNTIKVPSAPATLNVQPQQQRRRTNPATVSSAAVSASHAKSHATTNVIIDTKSKKNSLTTYKNLVLQVIQAIQEAMRTKVVLSLIDGAKSEYRAMKEKCVLAINLRSQYPEGYVRVYQQPYAPSAHQPHNDDSSNDGHQGTPENQQHDLHTFNTHK